MCSELRSMTERERCFLLDPSVAVDNLDHITGPPIILADLCFDRLARHRSQRLLDRSFQWNTGGPSSCFVGLKHCPCRAAQETERQDSCCENRCTCVHCVLLFRAHLIMIMTSFHGRSPVFSPLGQPANDDITFHLFASRFSLIYRPYISMNLLMW